MKKMEGYEDSLRERLSDTFALPKDILANETLVHMIGGKDMYIENYRGILAYSCCEIVIKGYQCKIVICGKGLVIAYYSDEDMKVSGRIHEIKMIR